jgi:hypothetical protein
MCSSLIRRLATLTLAAAVVSVIGCGHKGTPKPPPQRIPQPVRDLKVAQRGDRILLSFTYPQTTISGLPIDDIVAIELWEFEMPVPEFAPSVLGLDDQATTGEEDEDGDADADTVAPTPGDGEDGASREIALDELPDLDSETAAPMSADLAAEASPGIDAEDEPEVAAAPVAETATDEGAAEVETQDVSGATEGEPGAELKADDDDKGSAGGATASKELLLEIDPRQFEAAATKRIVLEGDDLSSAIHGDEVEMELTLDKIEPGEKEALIYGVKTFQTLKRASAFSNLARIIPRVTPEPPSEVELTAESRGVEITWAFEGAEPKEFRFYRRDPRSSGFGDHHATQDGDERSYLDSRAELGESYAYVMTAVINRTPLVESEFSAEREIEYTDEFPPKPPTDLVVFSDVGSARLLWEYSDDDDLAGYVVYRRSAGVEYERLFERPIRATEYEDTTVSSGRAFFYRVVAVDKAGNMSDPSEEVQVRIP